MAGIRILLAGCLAVLTAGTSGYKIQSPLLHSIDGFLAGGNTPVWTVDFPDPNGPPVYTKLQIGIVKAASDHWHKTKGGEGFPVRTQRSVENHSNVTKRDVSNTDNSLHDVLYPSILVVLDYSKHPLNAEANEEQAILNRIIYTLAYWNSVDIHLRNIQHPKVPLRIAGIVVNRSPKPLPYMANIDGAASDAMEKALNPMLDYWRNLAHTSEDFPLGSYDIVAHLTDSYGYSDKKWSSRTSASSTAPPCNQKDNIAGLIVYDNYDFNSIRTTVVKMTYIFGDKFLSTVDWHKIFDFKPWTVDVFNNIFNGLIGQSCMSAPKEYHPPGNPVPTILPGEVYPAEKQCEAMGWNKENFRNCWDEENASTTLGGKIEKCNYQYCTNWRNPFHCGYSNPTLDGTTCPTEKNKFNGICVHGYCVVKP